MAERITTPYDAPLYNRRNAGRFAARLFRYGVGAGGALALLEACGGAHPPETFFTGSFHVRPEVEGLPEPLRFRTSTQTRGVMDNRVEFDRIDNIIPHNELMIGDVRVSDIESFTIQYPRTIQGGAAAADMYGRPDGRTWIVFTLDRVDAQGRRRPTTVYVNRSVETQSYLQIPDGSPTQTLYPRNNGYYDTSGTLVLAQDQVSRIDPQSVRIRE